MIKLEEVRQNNLRGGTVEFPLRQMSVITGPSGSGKSSLAFDTLYAEGQRRYIESLSTYTRQFLEKMPKPEVGHVANIPPAIALEQRNSVVNSRSTVGTQTEILDYLRILLAKLGETHCLRCDSIVSQVNAETVYQFATKYFLGKKSAVLAPLAEETLKPQALMEILREQGFQRVLWKSEKKDGSRVFDLDDLGTVPKDLKKGRWYIVLDRFVLSKASLLEEETRTRMMEAIEQAIRIGNDAVALIHLETFDMKSFECKFACVECGTEAPLPTPQLLSFNSPVGACNHCNGFGHTLDLDESLVVPDPAKTLKNGAIDPFTKPSMTDWQVEMFRFAEKHDISIGRRYRELTQEQRELLWEGHPKDKTFMGIRKCFEFLARKKYKIHVRVFVRRYQSQSLCNVCHGARVNPHALHLFFKKHNLHDLTQMTVTEALRFFEAWKLTPAEAHMAEEIASQVLKRLRFLEAVGVGYLTLERLTKTLSGGEFQRINLATQLGSGLCGTLYVLDEPSIGLHAADTERLIGVLKDLRDQGNTVVVVEHDADVIRSADWLVEIGPAAGKNGGEVLYQGDLKRFSKESQSTTALYLSGKRSITRDRPLREEPRKWLEINGCKEHNLQNLHARFPIERLVVVTGVSGSGKSTLVHQTLYPALLKALPNPDALTLQEEREVGKGGAFQSLYGAEQLGGVVLLDQKPIGRSSRSNPATYMKAWDEVRRIYSNQVVSIRRGYTPQKFSFNVEGGRCPTCKGEGEITLDMHFMADIRVVCEDCDGRRFKKEVLDITFQGKNIYQLLQTTIDESYDLFRQNAILRKKLGLLRDVGLGYLQLGQSATTLSGGESQRLKIAEALDSRQGERLLYIFDEPTTGLHLEDIKNLMRVLQDLVEQRNSLILIEHHLDVIAQADWVLDLGPGGGKLGGQLMGEGPPDELMRNENSMTGRMLLKAGYFPEKRKEPVIQLGDEIPRTAK